MPEVCNFTLLACDPQPDLLDLAVLDLQQLIEPAELVEQVESRGMNRVTAKIAEEVLVLLQHGHLDARPGKQHSDKYSCRPPANDDYRQFGIMWHLGRAPLFRH